MSCVPADYIYIIYIVREREREREGWREIERERETEINRDSLTFFVHLGYPGRVSLHSDVSYSSRNTLTRARTYNSKTRSPFDRSSQRIHIDGSIL